MMKHITKQGVSIPINEMSHEHLLNTIGALFKHSNYSRRALAIPYIKELLARAELQQEVEQDMAVHPCNLGSYGVYKMDN